MTAPTHIASAEFLYLLLLTTAGVGLSAVNASVIALASILADIDTESSTMGKILPFVSLPLERRFGHRTLTHSAVFVTALAVAALPLLSASKDVYTCLIVGYATHPFLDTMNVSGVRLFYPFAQVRCVFPFDVNAPSRFRTPTGSKMDRALGILFFVGCIPTFLISQQGHERFIRLTQRDIESAVRDYNELSMTHRVYAELKAHNLFTKEAIQGRYEIVGALDERTLLFREESGELHSLGRDHESEYTAESAVCYPGEPTRTVVNAVELENQPLEALAAAVDPGMRTYLFGEVFTREPFELRWTSGTFTPVTGSAHTMRFRYATLGDIERQHLGRVLVVHGRITLRTAVPVDLETVQTLAHPDSAGGFVVLAFEVPLGATVVMHAALGDTVVPGQLLVESRPDTLQRLKGDLEKAKRVAALASQRSELASLMLQCAQLTDHLREDSLELIRLRQLQEEGFAPENLVGAADEKWGLAKDRRGILERRIDVLRRKMMIRSQDYALRPLEEAATERRLLRSEIRGVVHDVRKSVKARTVELLFILRSMSR